MLKILSKFGIVGFSAMGIHWLTAVIMTTLGMLPGVANLIGFLVAFQFSYRGHHNWTFNPQAKHKATPKQKYFLVAATGFLVNEVIYELTLNQTDYDFRLVLAVILVLVGGATFLACRYWAFR